MNSDIVLAHAFVEFIPEALQERTVYISVRFATVSHLCVCGCGNKVVTPLQPTAWQLIFDGKTVSLYPSIGNWSLPCQSHYWIRKSGVRWAEPWSTEHITAGRAHDQRVTKEYFEIVEPDGVFSEKVPASAADRWRAGMWRALREWWGR